MKSTPTAATDWLDSFIAFQFNKIGVISLVYRLRLRENRSLLPDVVCMNKVTSAITHLGSCVT